MDAVRRGSRAPAPRSASGETHILRLSRGDPRSLSVMERTPGSKRARFVGALALGVLALLALVGAIGVHGLRRHPNGYRPAALSGAASDLAVSCLALGTVVPPVDELALSELEAIVTIVGRLAHAYQQGSFDSFLALRAGDLAFAEERFAGNVEELRALCRELGLAPAEIPDGWIGALRAFWVAYYVEPPLLALVPEAARVALHVRESPGEDWTRSFQELYERLPGATILHRLMVPHRRGLDEVLAPEGLLTWIDLDLAFEGRVPPSGRLVARFVWDAAASEWFLERAATVYEDGVGPDRRCLVL